MNRLMIVARSDFEAFNLEQSLVGEGVEILRARNLDEIRKLLRRASFDVVIFLDLAPYFTVYDGVALVRHRGAVRPRIYVISRCHDEQVIMGLLESGVSQYFTFPVNLVRLRYKVYCEFARL